MKIKNGGRWVIQAVRAPQDTLGHDSDAKYKSSSL